MPTRRPGAIRTQIEGRGEMSNRAGRFDRILAKAAVAVAVAAVAVGLSVAGMASADTHPASRPARKPTVVLVHGAFADASGFGEIARRLTADGYPVVAAANPLRGVASDAASIAALLDSIDGPIVLVGHSYGGTVISKAAVGNADVKALVYIAAYLPETGETAAELTTRFPGSEVPDSLKPVALPDGGTDLYINPTVFPASFAGDVPVRQAKIFALSQRPATAAALNEPFPGVPAWHSIPSYDLISGSDRIIPPAAQKFMAGRAHAKVRVIKAASHMGVFFEHPGTTTALIERAAYENT
jgi:pimeloyl-ACP methyl ester carboxylesterase